MDSRERMLGHSCAPYWDRLRTGVTMSKLSDIEKAIGEHRQRMLIHAKSILWNHADAEDAVQSACIAACAAIDEYNPDMDIVPWLVGIVRHKSLEQRRRRRRRGEKEVPESTILSDNVPLDHSKSHSSDPWDGDFLNERDAIASTFISRCEQVVRSPCESLCFSRIAPRMSNWIRNSDMCGDTLTLSEQYCLRRLVARIAPAANQARTP